MMKLLPFIVVGHLLLSVSCVSPERNAKPPTSDLDWDDLTTQKHMFYQPTRGSNAVMEESLISHFPRNLQLRPDLSELALRSGIGMPRYYADGVIGKKKQAFHYLTSPSRLHDEDMRFYWVMVKVLSEKFGCLMRGQYRWKSHTAFVCKDKRMVVFQEAKSKIWWRFSVRQYDTHGREIIVENRRIVYRKEPRALPHVFKTYLAGLQSPKSQTPDKL